MALDKPVRRIAIVGTGVIGASWAAEFLAKGFDVIATDPGPNAEANLRKYVDTAWPALTARIGDQSDVASVQAANSSRGKQRPNTALPRGDMCSSRTTQLNAANEAMRTNSLITARASNPLSSSTALRPGRLKLASDNSQQTTNSRITCRDRRTRTAFCACRRILGAVVG